MRGKEGRYQAVNEFMRITPAYAGKRLLVFFGFADDWDHPRVCGEKTKKIP